MWQTAICKRWSGGACYNALNSGIANRSMLPDNLFPPNVRLVLASEEMWQTPLCAEEESLIEGTILKRQREFRAGRNAAHEALRQLAAPSGPLLRGSRREPVWPAGYIGTISHCRDLCVAACATDEVIAGLGVDVEPLSPLPAGVERYIHTAVERGLKEAVPERLIFSAKESLYKCYYPLLNRFFGFQSVSLTFDTIAQTFTFEPTAGCEIDFPSSLHFHGRYQIGPSHLLTACHLTRS